MIELERARGFVPGPVLVVLAVTVVFGLVFEPVSGFVTLLVPLGFGALSWWRARNRQATAA
ncbi:DUF6463 family protein [Nocardia sp. SSK8]|uniref:DUF6463 family protein n=1 Tax=Nocardia sp. SSK8 TaxID=3120154 RepID=UPI00300B2001